MLITTNGTEQLLRNQEAEQGNRNTENVTSTQTHRKLKICPSFFKKLSQT